MTEETAPSHPLTITQVALVAGVVLVGAAFAVLDESWSAGGLANELCIGILIAAAVAVAVDLVTQRFDQFVLVYG